MKKIKNFGSFEKINGRMRVTTDHILEAALYLTMHCYIYSYHINEESIEYIIAGADIESKKIKITGRTQKIKIRSLVESFNYLVDFETNLFKKNQGGNQ